MTEYFTEFRARSFAQFADLEERLKVSNSALEVLEQVADPVMEMAFPDARNSDNPPSRLELLKATPGRMRTHMKEVALISSDQALAIVKSQNPWVDLGRVGKGFAADVDEEKVASLLEEARPISNLLVENLELDSPVE